MSEHVPDYPPETDIYGQLDAFADLSLSQQQVIHALLTHPTLKAAAEAAGVDPRTVRRHMHDPTFARAFREARLVAMQETITALQQRGLKAVETFDAAMSEDTPDINARVRGARSTLDYLVKLFELETKVREIEDIELRLAELEERLG